MNTGFSTRIDMTGRRYGKWLVLEYSHKDKDNQVYWKCVCDCGNTASVAGKSLRQRNSKSCGCYNAEKASATHRIPHKTIDGVERKRCCKCKTWVSVSDFSKSSQKWDGLSNRCKSCSALVRKEKPRNKKYFREWANKKYAT